jgi:PAS domain-containing protein
MTGEAKTMIKPETNNEIDKDQLIRELISYKQMVQEKEEFLGKGSFEINMVSGAQQMSRGFLSVFGLEVNTPPTTLHEVLRQYFDAGEQHRILEFFKHISETGEGREIEVTSTVNGGQKDLEIFAKVHRNTDGKTERIVGTIKDITAIKTLYNQLLQFKSELTKRELLLKHGTWEYDIRSGTYDISVGLYHVFGADPEDQQRKFRMDDFYMPGEQQKTDQLMHEVIQVGIAYVDDLMVRTPAGELKYVEIFARLVRDNNGEPERIIGITRDITRVHAFKIELKDQLKQVDMMNQELTEAKKKLEIQLEELEKANIELQLYKQTMLDKDEFLNQGTWEWDINANRMNYSRGIYRLFGYHHRDEMKEWDEDTGRSRYLSQGNGDYNKRWVLTPFGNIWKGFP